VPDARQLSSFLLELHSRSHELGYRAMQRFALERYRALVPLDGALVVVGTIQGGEPQAHDVFAFEEPPELMRSWETIKQDDRLVFEATQSPGTTISIAVSSAYYDGRERVREHYARFDIEYLQCTAHVYAAAGLYSVIALRRSPSRPAFTEDERLMTELVSPHLVAASRTARLGELRSLTRLGGGHGQLAAIASASGLVLDAEPGLADVLQLEWPRWRGPFLPPELMSALAAGPSSDAARFVGERIVVRVDATDDARLVHVRRRVAADELTARERQIAGEFALGASHREIGESLGIAPATVRRHLANIYEKLGVSSKAELDRMLRDL
jgi:DNA-binding CsgD family transcriptional regulator